MVARTSLFIVVYSTTAFQFKSILMVENSKNGIPQKKKEGIVWLQPLSIVYMCLLLINISSPLT